MFDLERFIAEKITGRRESLFLDDIEANRSRLSEEIQGRSLCVIGGAGSIGSSFIKAVLPFRPRSLVVVDINENGLAELTRDLRSSLDTPVPERYLTYPVDFGSEIFRHIFLSEGGFDIVANFSAHKHVRSEKDRFSVQALLTNNDLKAKGLLDLLSERSPRHFFCVSTDKAANPVNVMGASKRIMEDLIMAYSSRFSVTTARFANVAFSNGSLPQGWMERLAKRQPLAAPSDVRRYFVSPRESGQICMLACMLGRSGEVFFPKLGEEKMLRFSDICTDFLRAHGLQPALCASDQEAKIMAASMPEHPTEWPVVYFPSDTSGEKDYEEFFVEGETLDMHRFRSLGVIERSPHRPMEEIDAFFRELREVFANPDFTKAQVVEAMEKFLPTFHHIERNRSLDMKM